MEWSGKPFKVSHGLQWSPSLNLSGSSERRSSKSSPNAHVQEIDVLYLDLQRFSTSHLKWKTFTNDTNAPA